MKNHRLIIAAIIFILGLAILISFNVEYPCTMSGCGCSNTWEMLHDTWSDIVGFFLIICSGVMFTTGLISEGETNEKKKM